uniref:Hsp20/alpha crystallin family protein n=1 Tax=Schlesneria paludicola TaxID=360056 RepID=A0A7C4LM29_9PLAN
MTDEQPLAAMPGPAAEASKAEPQIVFTPPIDIFETEDGLVLLADLPGVSADTLELQVQDNKLTLFGKVRPPVGDDARLLHQEYRVGHFLRSFILSDEVDHERITAKLNHGVLEVTLPRVKRSEPRRIHVSSPG